MLTSIDSPFPTTVEFADDQADAQPRLTVLESDDSYGKFQISGLKRGWGITLGNGLRRVLLGGLPGVAITSARITGQVHEYDSIPHMREGIVEFLINVRGIRIKPLSDTSQKVLTLLAEGECDVVAGDIMPHSGYEIVNPEQHLATLDNQDAKLEVRFEVERGEGYRPFNPEESSAIGKLPVDAIFSPVLKAHYEVEDMSGRMAGKESLIIEVWTDRTMTPEEVMLTAAEVFKSELDIITETLEVKEPKSINLPESVAEQEIADLTEHLSKRTMNALIRHGINTIGQLETYHPDQLKNNVRNFGAKSFNELYSYMNSIGAWQEDSASQ